MFQKSLFKPVFSAPNKQQLAKFELLFSNLPLIIPAFNTGRPPTYSKFSLLCTLIYKNFRCLHSFLDLINEINDSPDLASLLNIKLPINKERISSFLIDTPNSYFKLTMETIVNELISLGGISTEYLSTDSCPIFSPIRENNLITNVSNRFLKSKIPKGDPGATLGAYVIYPDKKKIAFFWGYRNHIINDAVSELPLSEITKPNNVHDSSMFIPHFSSLKKTFSLNTKAVIADAAYDSYNNFDFVVIHLNAKPVIALNPRAGKHHKFKLSSAGEPICLAGFPMSSRGKFFEKPTNRWRHKFICPIKGSKKFARKHPLCPWNHPKFFSNHYGCCVNLRTDIDESIRNSINRSSKSFKKIYNLRTSSERIFSRLLLFFLQHPTITGLKPISNICTIAHITVLLIALTAVKSGHKDKARFVKNFLQII